MLAMFRGLKVANEPLKDEDFWWNRADEARRAADSLTHPTAKRELLLIAENFERLAKKARAAGRKAAASTPSHRTSRDND